MTRWDGENSGGIQERKFMKKVYEKGCRAEQEDEKRNGKGMHKNMSIFAKEALVEGEDLNKE